ncbi:MAG TPA: FlgD immunoglobulin-like domain containing protein, partial [Candidatus Krumholzibacteria bacterium]|nr:FlgD immunoglobulin-like domain containing protein [Candidatus Krumholzibacteria bacterium]
SVLLFPENIAIHADSATTLVPATADYRTTFTIGSFSGCGIDSALVSLYGMPLGYAHLNVKSRDVVCPSPPNPSRGKVDLLDFGTLGASYTSPPKPYNPCVDYVAAFGQINVGDFAAFGAHWNHSASGGGSAPESASIVVSGTVALEFEESHPLLGEHTLRATMSLEGVPAFKAAMFALRNENPKLEFMGWMEASGYPGETMTTETIRDGRREVFIGVLDADATEGDVVLGTAEFRVVSDQQLALTDDDLALVTADLLSNTDQRSTLALSSLAVRRAVTSVEYKNELAQNYPNPFNPTTTISFSLAQTADASLSIYDVRGALVKSLYNGRAERGIHRIVWDGTSNGGQQVASGVYFYKLTAGSFADTKKMTILK